MLPGVWPGAFYFCKISVKTNKLSASARGTNRFLPAEEKEENTKENLLPYLLWIRNNFVIIKGYSIDSQGKPNRFPLSDEPKTQHERFYPYTESLPMPARAANKLRGCGQGIRQPTPLWITSEFLIFLSPFFFLSAACYGRHCKSQRWLAFKAGHLCFCVQTSGFALAQKAELAIIKL